MRTVITSVLITLILPLSATATSTKVDYTPWTVPISGAITANTTWSASSTYIVDGTVTVNAGVTLKISNLPSIVVER